MEAKIKRGGSRKNNILVSSAMSRLEKYPKIPFDKEIGTEKVTLYEPKLDINKKPGGNINVPLTRLKPQYKTIFEKNIQPQLSSASDVKATPTNHPRDGNNNTTSKLYRPQAKSAEPRPVADGKKESGKFQVNLNPKKDETLKEKVTKCICHRPKTHILCTICGYSSFGHIRMPCFAHLRVTYLLDMACCPRCNSGRLMEVTSRQ